MADLEQRFRTVCLRLWGEEQGEEVYAWIRDNRPPYFHAKLVEVMLPIWELNRVDLRTKILCCIAVFTAQHKQEVEFFIKMAKYHKIPREEVEEILLLTGLEAGFPTAEMAIQHLQRVYSADEGG
jgi:alkylhydroperoxidase/carboxymuconolactone decarboxylase family protein YurZ